MILNIESILAPKDGLVRNYASKFSVSVILTYEGSVLTAEALNRSNFLFRVFVSNNDTHFAQGNFSGILENWIELPSNISVGVLSVNSPVDPTTWLFQVDISTMIQNEICREISFLCLVFSDDRDDIYIELNPDDNIGCIAVEAFMTCQPGNVCYYIAS